MTKQIFEMPKVNKEMRSVLHGLDFDFKTLEGGTWYFEKRKGDKIMCVEPLLFGAFHIAQYRAVRGLFIDLVGEKIRAETVDEALIIAMEKNKEWFS